MKDDFSAYIIGPSNNGIKNLWEFGSIKKEEYNSYIHNIAVICNQQFSTVGCIPDVSTPFDIIKEIFIIPNRRVTIKGFYPKYGDDIALKDKKDFIDELVEINGGWSTMNTEISKEFDIMICVGLSAGVFTEISHTKVHRLWLKKITPILIDERTISSHLNKELENDVVIEYFRNDDELISLINKYKGGIQNAHV